MHRAPLGVLSSSPKKNSVIPNGVRELRNSSSISTAAQKKTKRRNQIHTANQLSLFPLPISSHQKNARLMTQAGVHSNC
jgi:hypothetical protein